MTTQLTDDEIENLWWGELDNRSLGSIRAIIAAHEAKQAQGEAVGIFQRNCADLTDARVLWLNGEPSDGTKFYTRPQQGEDARDAERYRKLMSASSALWLRLYNTRPDLREEVIDAAIAAQKGNESC